MAALTSFLIRFARVRRMSHSGHPLPSQPLWRLVDGQPQAAPAAEHLAQHCSLLVSVPGAFTPTCHNRHLPALAAAWPDLQAAGITQLFCMAANDAFVMQAWLTSLDLGIPIQGLSDPDAQFAEALGLASDASQRGMGKRGKRFCLLVEQGLIRHTWIDEPGQFVQTHPDTILQWLQTHQNQLT